MYYQLTIIFSYIIYCLLLETKIVLPVSIVNYRQLDIHRLTMIQDFYV